MAAKTAALTRNAGLDAAFDLLNSGKLRFYTTAQPTDADTALGAQTLLADLALGATAFAAAASGSKVANAITEDGDADATGTIAWGSLLNSSNARKMDFDVGTSGASLNVNSLSVSQHDVVQVTALTISQSA